MTAYINSKTAQLEPMLQGFLYEDMSEWLQTPLPNEPRDVCLELHFSLVMLIVYSRGAVGYPGLLRLVFLLSFLVVYKHRQLR